MTQVKQQLIDYCIYLADDALVLGQRLAEWCSNGPNLEEDLALANVSLDYIGRAIMFYEYAAELEGGARSADDIAFLRDSREYRNFLIAELPIGDFAFTMARQLVLDLFAMGYLEQLQQSTDPQLAAIAKKTIKESRYHLRRSREWALRLGDGTEESHNRMQRALDEIWGYTHELFEMSNTESALLQHGIAVDRAALQAEWNQQINEILAEATLKRPDDSWSVRGGRDGIHTEHLGPMLETMQFLQRAYPGLKW